MFGNLIGGQGKVLKSTIINLARSYKINGRALYSFLEEKGLINGKELFCIIPYKKGSDPKEDDAEHDFYYSNYEFFREAEDCPVIGEPIQEEKNGTKAPYIEGTEKCLFVFEPEALLGFILINLAKLR